LATARCRPSAWSCMMLSRLVLAIVRCVAICRTCTEAATSAIPCRIVAKCSGLAATFWACMACTSGTNVRMSFWSAVRSTVAADPMRLVRQRRMMS